MAGVDPADTIVTPVYCPHCEGDGCEDCDQRGWRFTEITRARLRELLGLTEPEER